LRKKEALILRQLREKKKKSLVWTSCLVGGKKCRPTGVYIAPAKRIQEKCSRYLTGLKRGERGSSSSNTAKRDSNSAAWGGKKEEQKSRSSAFIPLVKSCKSPSEEGRHSIYSKEEKKKGVLATVQPVRGKGA